MKRFLLGALVSGMMVIGFQTIPPYIPDDGDDTHLGQPMFCLNYDSIEGGKNCDCHKSCKKGAPEDPKCSVYCRKNACKCNHKCDS